MISSGFESIPDDIFREDASMLFAITTFLLYLATISAFFRSAF